MLPYICLSCFIRDLEVIHKPIWFLPGGGREKKRGKRPTVFCRQLAEPRWVSPGSRQPPGLPSLPLGPPLLWLPGAIWQGWPQPAAWASWVLFFTFWGQEGGGLSCG